MKKPFPLFESLKVFRKQYTHGSFDSSDVTGYALLHEHDLQQYISDLNYSSEFLYEYSKKSEATYNRFRNEIERFLLWSLLIAEKSVVDLKRVDIDEYIDFFWSPPASWMGTKIVSRMECKKGKCKLNKKWRPFVAKVSKTQRSLASEQDKEIKVDKKDYQPSIESLKACFVALNAFYEFLMLEEYTEGNPVKVSKKRCPYFVEDTTSKDVMRLTDLQWDVIVDTAEKIAHENSRYERHLFLVMAVKALKLRISELGVRKSTRSDDIEWTPVFGHFYINKEYWVLKVFGKGRKTREVTVPDALLPYLDRYREHLGLLGRPTKGEKQPIIGKERGSGGMTARHLTRLIQVVFDKAVDILNTEGHRDQANELRAASTHWLRHTQASQEVTAGRPLKHISDDLGHASLKTTDEEYVQSDLRERGESARKTII